MNPENSNYQGSELYWNKLINRFERILGWFLFVTGILILVSYGIYQLIINLFKDAQLSLFVRAGIFFVVIGIVILIFSVIRERITIGKGDKYKGLEQ